MSDKQPMTQKEYVNSGAGACPNCGDEQIEGGSIVVEGSAAWQPVSCLACDARWNDTYEITGYAELEIPEAEKETEDK